MSQPPQSATARNAGHQATRPAGLPIVLLTTLLLLTVAQQGCQTAAPLPSLPADAPADFSAERFRPGPGEQLLQIAQSQLTVLVYRAGPLKHLGHNHVITSEALQGLVLRAADNAIANSYADLYLPLATLVVDDPQARLAAGADFTSKPSAADRRGTLGNLLGPKLLEASRYPYLRADVRLQSLTEALITLRVKAHSVALRVPIALNQDPSGLELTATFEVTHAQLGLTPIAALGGALTVADPITISLQMSAEPAFTLRSGDEP